MDVRFLPNPYYIPDLSPLDGRDPRVREFLRSTEELKYFFEKFGDLLDYLVPLYEMEPRSCLTLAVGCTGGRHRSVMVTEELRSRFEAMGKEVALCHRDIHLP